MNIKTLPGSTRFFFSFLFYPSTTTLSQLRNSRISCASWTSRDAATSKIFFHLTRGRAHRLLRGIILTRHRLTRQCIQLHRGISFSRPDPPLRYFIVPTDVAVFSRLNCGKCCRSSATLIVNYSTRCNAALSAENGNAAIVCFRVLFEFLLVNRSTRVHWPQYVTKYNFHVTHVIYL